MRYPDGQGSFTVLTTEPPEVSFAFHLSSSGVDNHSKGELPTVIKLLPSLPAATGPPAFEEFRFPCPSAALQHWYRSP